jgi:hypothetical protein
MRLAGVAKVDMDVDQPRRDDQAFGIYHRSFGFLGVVQVVHDFTVDGKDIAECVALIGRIDNPTILYPKYV